MNEKNIGGKALNLNILTENKIPVPKYFVISTNVYKRFLKENKIEKEIKEIIKNIDFKNKNNVRYNSQKIKNLFLKNKIPYRDKEKILTIFSKIKKQTKNEYYAVRSSAIGEDSSKQSFAGQMDSFLFISKEEDILRFIKKCWASAYSKRALTYRKISKIDLSDIYIAVIIQEMIFGEKSGVVFTANPLNNNHEELLINSTYGIGEGIVLGELNTDTIVYNKKINKYSFETVEKKHKIDFNKKEKIGTIKTVIPKEKQKKLSLSEKEIQKLADYAKKIENIQKKPQDIEWTIKKEKIYILQTRPITTLKEKDEKKIIWDNSNIIESFPGITGPLTFSFAKTSWASVFRQTALAMGVSKKTIEKNSELFNNMLGLIHGRVYYNLMNWYKFVSFFPGFKNNKKYMEQMMGIKKSLKFKQEKKVSTEKIKNIPGLTKLIYGLIKNHLLLDRKIKNFHQNFEKNYNQLKNLNIKNKKPWEIIEIYKTAKNKLLNGWEIEGINDYSAMYFYGLVKKLTIKYDLDSTGSLQNDLFCGEKDMDSTKPTKELIKLSDIIKKDKKLAELFKHKNEKEILNEIKNNEKIRDFKNKFESYLKEYGFRCMSELKLEEKSLIDDPSFLITIIKNYLKKENLDLEKLNKKELEKRKNTEKIIHKKLRYKPFKKLFFRWALKNARKSVKYRENLRLCRTKVFGIVREAFRAIGKYFSEQNIIDKKEDIFYLEIDEIFNFIKGTSTTINLKNIIKTRREEYKKFKKEKLPERFTTYGIVNNKNIEKIIIEKENKNITSDILKGISCCPGIVKNKARVILSPDDNVELNGEILVADKTDPGWVPLYPSVSGLLIERGSVLSHSAIVARELGLPTIVGIRGLTSKIKDGEIIKMDAEKGIVYLKPEKKEENKK